MEVDIEQFASLREYLLASGHILPGEKPICEKLSGGVSNRAVLVKRKSATSIVLKQALDKLRVQADWFSDPARIHIEAEALRRLPDLAPHGSIPVFLFEDFENHIVAMEAVAYPHRDWKSLLLQGVIIPSYFEDFGTLLGAIHLNSHLASADLRQVFDDRSYFESLRLEPYYLYSAEQVPEAASFLKKLVNESRRYRTALVHGDYSPKNILIHHDRLVLLDFEVVHFGDPAFDLGFSLTHFLSKGNQFGASQFLGAAILYWQSYRQITEGTPIAEELEPRAVRHTLGCLLARIVGRSPLEYLGPAEQRRQRESACRLMHKPPTTVEDLIAEWSTALESDAAY